MPPTPHLACVLHFHQAPVARAKAIEAAFDSLYEPLLSALEAAPSVRLNLYFTGSLLEHAARQRPGFLERLAVLWREERVEVLGGGFHDPILPSIPERDSLGQLQYAANFIKRNLGRLPAGAWLSLRAWSPGLIRILASAGCKYTLLDDAQFAVAGVPSAELRGHWATEWLGRAMAIFPIDSRLSAALAADGGEGLCRALEGTPSASAAARPPRVAVVSGAELGGSETVKGLVDVLQREAHRIKTTLLQTAWENFESEGRVYLPSGSRPDLADWCQSKDSSVRRAERVAELQARGDWDSALQLRGGLGWDNFLAKYPEANAIHKRMLRVSKRIDQLRSLLAKGHREGKNVEAPRKVLEKACAALWRSQGHSVYWHGAQLNQGIYDPELRQRSLRELLLAEKAVDRILEGRRPAGWETLVADHDGDSEPEVLVHSRNLGALIDPGAGGTLAELDLRGAGFALQSSFQTVEEPYHASSAGNEVVLVQDEDETLGEERPGAEASEAPAVQPAIAKLVLGAHRYAAFQDRFLESETRVEAFARRQFRELGDFASRPYELVKAGEVAEGGQGQVTVGRSAVVRDLAQSFLLRIEKSFRFDVERPRLSVLHSIHNRSRDPASVRFGLEWAFGIPSSRPEGVRLRAVGPDDQEQRCELLDGPADLGSVSWIEWEDTEAGLAVVLELDRPMGLWWCPVTTVHSRDSALSEVIQGNALLLHSPLEIWGEEQQQLELRVDFVSTR